MPCTAGEHYWCGATTGGTTGRAHLLEQRPVRVLRECDRPPGLARARGAPDAVEVGSQGRGGVEVDDRLHSQDVEAARRHVCGQQKGGLALRVGADWVG
jgi:hypothetical protein